MDEFFIEMKVKRKHNDHFETVDKYFGKASNAFNIIKKKYLGSGTLKKLDNLLLSEIEEFNKKNE